jgi:hypothetical protein
MKKRQVSAGVAVMALVLAACGGATNTPETTVGSDDAETTTTTTSPVPGTETTVTIAAQGVLPEGPSALDDMNDDGFPTPLVATNEIISGGPPPDGIPPIDDPVFIPVAENLDLLDAAEAVVALEVNGEARAYPVRAMIWHEIVNDTVGGIPVSVTYCPLCNSAVSYRREIRGVETTFGTSGRLFASALVMYDRATESLWTHFDGRAVVGILTGEQLESIPSPLMAWGDFRSAYPTGQVLDWTATGFRRNYGVNPYTGYDDPATDPFLFRGALDDRAVAKQRVVGVEIGDAAVAFSLDLLAEGEANVLNEAVGGEPIVIFWKSGQASALDRAGVGEGADVGTVGVFDPRVDGDVLSFRAEGEDYVDDSTGSVWNVAGEAVEGPLTGSRLERLDHLDTFWFAWSTYKPGTGLVGP